MVLVVEVTNETKVVMSLRWSRRLKVSQLLKYLVMLRLMWLKLQVVI